MITLLPKSKQLSYFSHFNEQNLSYLSISSHYTPFLSAFEEQNTQKPLFMLFFYVLFHTISIFHFFPSPFVNY